jgi:hypothetical protein
MNDEKDNFVEEKDRLLEEPIEYILKAIKIEEDR